MNKIGKKSLFLALLIVFVSVNVCFALSPATILPKKDNKSLSFVEIYPDVKKGRDKNFLKEYVAKLLIDKETPLIIEKREADVKRIFMDWGGTLDDLTNEELQALVRVLKQKGFSLSVLSLGGSPLEICNKFKQAGVLDDFDQVISVYNSTMRSETKELFEDSKTEMIFCFPHDKKSYLGTYISSDETVVLIDNDPTKMSPNANVINIGICGKNAKSIESLVEPGSKWFHYALADLTQLNAVDTLFDSIAIKDHKLLVTNPNLTVEVAA